MTCFPKWRSNPNDFLCDCSVLKISIFLAAPGLSCIIWNPWSLWQHAGSFSCHVQALICSVWDLVPQPGVKPRTSTLGVWRLNHRITRKSLWLQYFKPLIGSVMAACWSEMESIHGINVWLAGAKCSQRHPTPGGWPKVYMMLITLMKFVGCWFLTEELMRNGSIYNTSWENQSRGTFRSLSFNFSNFSFSHNNTENEYCVSWAWLESNTVMSSQLRLSCVRICSAHLGKVQLSILFILL